jgi:hypothetical protein
LITSIWSHHDNIVSPQDTSELEGARNLALGGVGHVALGRNRRVLALVMAELEPLRSRPAEPLQSTVTEPLAAAVTGAVPGASHSLQPMPRGSD